MNHEKPKLRLKRLGIDTYKEAVIYMRQDCYVCVSEGFEAQARVRVSRNHNGGSIIATLNIVMTDILKPGEASLSEYAWKLLQAREGDEVKISHIEPLHSLSYIRGKMYGKKFKACDLNEIVKDIVAGRYADVHVSAFITACAGNRLDRGEIRNLTKAMINTGERIIWPSDMVVDKHCVGGLPGNRTTLLVVPIVAAFGLMIPKTSSRAITSSSGTADTMETLAPVDLSFEKMQKVVEQENGCIAWGGNIELSPADDILIRVERVLNIDSEGQLVASVLSKKIAAGSQHVIIDIPIGPTSKVRSQEQADELKQLMEGIGKSLGLNVRVVYTDGMAPVGRGIGPALEARDVLQILNNEPNAPQDLKERGIYLAGKVLEFSPKVEESTGADLARSILESGAAWKKFQAICEAQGGMRIPPVAMFTRPFLSKHRGRIKSINNRLLAEVGKLAGAPVAKAAGIDLHVSLNSIVDEAEPLFTVHAETKGELAYAFEFLREGNHIFEYEEID